MRDDKTDFTQGSILKKLSWFMLPVLGALAVSYTHLDWACGICLHSAPCFEVLRAAYISGM